MELAALAVADDGPLEAAVLDHGGALVARERATAETKMGVIQQAQRED